MFMVQRNICSINFKKKVCKMNFVTIKRRFYRIKVVYMDKPKNFLIFRTFPQRDLCLRKIFGGSQYTLDTKYLSRYWILYTTMVVRKQ